MSAIVKIRNKKSGTIYAYEQTAKWDPEKGQARPVRKHLGRYDEETDTIIPSTGRRGRKPAETPTGDVSLPLETGIQESLPLEVETQEPGVDTETDDLRRKHEETVAENERMMEALTAALQALNEAAETIEVLLGQKS
jgi:hypothetical protein